jgi:hypothetical protein
MLLLLLVAMSFDDDARVVTGNLLSRTTLANRR